VWYIEEGALSGPALEEECFHLSYDAYELADFLQREDVQKLINGKQLVWNPEIERFPDTPVRWYFDETILCIVWQEVEAHACGTFSEIIIADGSQLRRRISGDTPWSYEFRTTSSFAFSSNAVLASGGDFYFHGRNCGISVYDRQIVRFEPYTCDSCFFTSDGDMLFVYRGQMTDQAEAEQFIAENDVLFSLGFGPVLVDDYVDVTPDSYPWGEINDTYARAALGMFEEHHYLLMNINCWRPGTEYYYLATLRQAADAMIARGCRKAYTLDGGQTATTVFHNELINPVQFGWEKDISDVIYFASAKGAEVKYVPWYEIQGTGNSEAVTDGDVSEITDDSQSAIIISE
jgi:exopolysaccharide biosynthesis protein